MTGFAATRSEAVGADLLGAHARLAALETAPGGRLCEGILDALLLGAGLTRGAGLDSAGVFVVLGFAPAPEVSARFAALSRDAAVPGELVQELFAPCGVSGEPCAIPLTAGDDLVYRVLLEGPPADPAGFASVTAHAAAFLSRVRMAERIREASFELKYRVWELESLYDVGLSITRTLDLSELADEILLRSVSLLNARAGALLVRERGSDRPALVKNFGSELLTGTAAEESFDLPDVLRSNDRSQREGPLAAIPAEKILVVPISCDDRRVGMLLVADKENRQGGVDDFAEGDERIIRLFGNQAAIALENARLHREALEKERIEREIELAASIQKTILPDALPSVPGLSLAGGNRPTRQVGGDYYDVFPLADGRTAFVVADVSGKGVPAALLVSTLHACLHLLVEGDMDDLPRVVARLNRQLFGFSSTRKFVTLFFAVHDRAAGTLRYVNAGHNPGLLLSKGTLTELPSGGLPIGMLQNVTHRSDVVPFVPSDLLVLYSDGITEALDGEDREFGMERLISLVRSGVDQPVAALSREIFDAVSAYTRGVAQYDDQTVLVARAV